MMQNITATIANALSNKINVHVTHDYMTMSSISPSKMRPSSGTDTNAKNSEPDKVTYNPQHHQYAQDCSELSAQGQNKSGIYMIQPEVMPVSPTDSEIEPFEVYCDMDTDGGGGWTVFQRRYNGLVNFYRNWEDYKNGFGYLMGDYWLGLERMHRMTAIANYELRIDLQDYYGNGGWATYDNFQIGDEGTFYTLLIGEYKGTATDSLTYHNNMPFSTKDKDNDKHETSHCAQQYKGAWWYKECFRSNLNGEYLRSLTDRGVMNWYDTNDALKKSEMKIRRAKKLT